MVLYPNASLSGRHFFGHLLYGISHSSKFALPRAAPDRRRKHSFSGGAYRGSSVTARKLQTHRLPSVPLGAAVGRGSWQGEFKTGSEHTAKVYAQNSA